MIRPCTFRKEERKDGMSVKSKEMEGKFHRFVDAPESGDMPKKTYALVENKYTGTVHRVDPCNVTFLDVDGV